MTLLDAALTWNTQQQDAVAAVRDWYHHGREQVFRLFGYAGTGKTTLAKHIVTELELDGRALYAAYTGKAAHVLRSKGCTDARTIHSLIYIPREKAAQHLRDLRRQLDEATDSAEQRQLRREIHTEQRRLETPDWILRPAEECDLTYARLLIVDEVSMVNEKMAGDLLTYGTKILVLGDPAQLPPVDGGGWFTEADPDQLLTQIHRSALHSPVTRLATAARTAPVGDRTLGIPGRDGDSGRRSLHPGEWEQFHQVLVWKNATRWAYIHALRAMKGRTGPIPHPGERIMILANNAEHEVFNGQQLTVEAVASSLKKDSVLHIEAFDDDDRPHELPVSAHGFVDISGEKEARREAWHAKTVAATFADAITVHKAQGSQWGNVLIIDETRPMWGMTYAKTIDVDPETARREAHLATQRWLYTAITRASDRAVILPAK